ncbi:MAG: response regulator transcription factor [Rhizobacter sp.]
MNRSAPAPIQVHIAHAYPLVARGIERVLGDLSDVSATLDDDDGALADIVIADYHDGLERTVRARGASPGRRTRGPRVVILTEWCREQNVRTAMEAGVAGYLQQGCSTQQFVDCIRQVAAGSRYIESELAIRMADSFSHEALTGRENDVLRVLVSGRCNKSIANDLGISVGTVKAHVKAIMAKLRAVSRTEAASIALQRGLLSDPPLARA